MCVCDPINYVCVCVCDPINYVCVCDLECICSALLCMKMLIFICFVYLYTIDLYWVFAQCMFFFKLQSTLSF